MRRLSTQQNITPPTTDFLDGRIKDDVGNVGTGTPVNERVYGDMHQFIAKIMRESDVTPNNLPDNESNGHQIFEAFRELAIEKPLAANGTFRGSPSNFPTVFTAANSPRKIEVNDNGVFVLGADSSLKRYNQQGILQSTISSNNIYDFTADGDGAVVIRKIEGDVQRLTSNGVIMNTPLSSGFDTTGTPDTEKWISYGNTSLYFFTGRYLIRNETFGTPPNTQIKDYDGITIKPKFLNTDKYGNLWLVETDDKLYLIEAGSTTLVFINDLSNYENFSHIYANKIYHEVLDGSDRKIRAYNLTQKTFESDYITAIDIDVTSSFYVFKNKMYVCDSAANQIKIYEQRYWNV